MLLLLLACTATDPAVDDTADDDGIHGRLESVSGREVLYLWGSRYEMGYAEGALTCDRIAGLFKTYLLEELISEYTSHEYELVRGVVLGSVTFEPGDEEEMEGYYQGAHDHCTEQQLTVESELLESDSGGRRMLEPEDLQFANALADFGCSSFSVWGDASSTGDTIHGRNFDWASDEDGSFLANHMVKVYDSTEEGARFASLMVPAMQGCVSCVSEEGVSLTMHNVGGLPTTTHSGISPRLFAARAALVATTGADDVASAAEAVLDARPQNVGSNLHMAYPLSRSLDGDGAVVFEWDGAEDHPDGRATARRVSGDPNTTRTDAIVAANHYIERSPPESEDNSTWRTAELRAAIEAGAQQGGVDRTAGRQMLTDIGGGYGGLIVHSIIVDSANRSMDVYVAPDAETPAIESDPVRLDLDELFDGLPD